jgi:hypothetical protein
MNDQFLGTRMGLQPTDLGDIKLFASWYRISGESLQHTPDAFCRGIFVIGRIL